MKGAFTFCRSYDEARCSFRSAARKHGWLTNAIIHPTLLTLRGDPLAVHVSCAGDPDAPHVLVSVSGTHGVEGLVGSAAQTAFIEHLGRHVPQGVRIVMVHAINPWGFDRLSRTNENNVDLNRNFIDWSLANVPDNPDYARIHTSLGQGARPSVTPASPDTASALKQEWGEARYYDAITRGQYTHPDGLMYGGSQREWSNRTLEKLIDEHVNPAAHVAFVDWHSGLGERGQAYFLCFSEPDSPGWQRACNWWGREKIERATAFGSAPTPNYQGLLIQAVERWVAPASFTGAVVEFGTRPYDEMLRAMGCDLQVKYSAFDSGAERLQLHQEFVSAFAPEEAAWQHSVVSQSIKIHGAALRGLEELSR